LIINYHRDFEVIRDIRDALYKYSPVKKSRLEAKDAYVSILNSIIPLGSDEHLDSNQQAHRDFLSSQINELESTDPKPLTSVIALEDNTKFCFFPNSHKKKMEELYRDEIPTEVILMKGEFVLFDASLVHYGGAYYIPPGNIRLHLYLLSAKCGVDSLKNESLTLPANSKRKADVNMNVPLTEPRPSKGGRKSHPNKVLAENFKKFKEITKLKKSKHAERGKQLGSLRRRVQIPVSASSSSTDCHH
jgi:hypothetical protein